MNKNRTIDEKTLIVGVDIGSMVNYAYTTTVLEPVKSKKKKSFSFEHSEAEYEKFIYSSVSKSEGCKRCVTVQEILEFLIIKKF